MVIYYNTKYCIIIYNYLKLSILNVKMPKKQELQVVKVPLKGSILSKPQVFPRMPRLYLELIENKEKIKQDLIDTEYIPPNVEQNNVEQNNVAQNNVEKYKSPTPSQSSSNKKFQNRLDMLLSDDNNSDISSDDNKSDISSDDTKSDNSTNKSPSVASTVTDLSIEEKEDSDKDKDKDDLSERLKALLDDDSESERSVPINKKSKSADKYSKHRDKNGHSIPTNNINVPPTLAELEANGGYVPRKELRDINQTNPQQEQQEEDVKRELLFKFDLLRKSYPGSSIPEYSIHTDLSTLEKSYNDSVRRLSLDSTVENYKTYLVYGFMGCEFIFGNFLGFDMQGFTQQQIISMHSYEKLLIEIGEKSYVPKGSNWPVELRLLFMIIMNAAFFVISKMMMKKTGANLMGMINNMSTPKQQAPTGPKRKMRGPDIDLSDLPDV